MSKRQMKFRVSLPGYNTHYRYVIGTSIAAKIDALNAITIKEGYRCGIVNLDDKGDIVERYTDSAVLELSLVMPEFDIKRAIEIAFEIIEEMNSK